MGDYRKDMENAFKINFNQHWKKKHPLVRNIQFAQMNGHIFLDGEKKNTMETYKKNHLVNFNQTRHNTFIYR